MAVHCVLFIFSCFRNSINLLFRSAFLEEEEDYKNSCEAVPLTFYLEENF